MSNRDLTSDVTTKVAQLATISSNTTTNGSAIDTGQTCAGVNFLFTCPTFSAGTFVINIQESDTTTSGDFTNVASAQIIGTEGTITAGNAGGDTVLRVGAFGTKRYVRSQIVSTGASGSNVLMVLAQQTDDIR